MSGNDIIPFRRVAIIGVGLIGGSIGLALKTRRLAQQVIGMTSREKTARLALEMGAVDEIAASIPEAVRGADLIILGTPVETILKHLDAVSTAIDRSDHLEFPIITDVGSAKQKIVAKGDACLPGMFVGGHPMAGSEESGVVAANVALFLGATWVFTQTAQTNPESLDRMIGFAQALGARTLVCDPIEHDRAVAALSHLPHLSAFALTQVADEMVAAGHEIIQAGSFRDTTRIALSSPALWSEILIQNAEEVLCSLDRMGRFIDELREAISLRDEARLQQAISKARQAKERFSRD